MVYFKYLRRVRFRNNIFVNFIKMMEVDFKRILNVLFAIINFSFLCLGSLLVLTQPYTSKGWRLTNWLKHNCLFIFFPSWRRAMDPDAEMTDEELDRNMETHGVTRVSLDINLPGDAEVGTIHRL